MVAPRHRSRSAKRLKVKTPGGKNVIHYRRKKPSSATCGRCKKKLGGVVSLRQSKILKLASSKRKPNRPFAATLCQRCTESLIRYKTLYEIKASFEDFNVLALKRDLTIEKFLPRGWWATLDIKEVTPFIEEEIAIVEEELGDEASETGLLEETKKEKPAEIEKPKKSPLAVLKVSELKGVGPKLEEELHIAGITSIDKLLKADPEELAEKISASEERISSLQDQAKKFAKQLK
ncbi:MAG: helix-hairpin-helix domain-containing protein [Candidatus Altiarchaeota archaeon]